MKARPDLQNIEDATDGAPESPWLERCPHGKASDEPCYPCDMDAGMEPPPNTNCNHPGLTEKILPSGVLAECPDCGHQQFIPNNEDYP